MNRKSKCLVVKLGTESLLGKSGRAKGRLDQKIFNHVAGQVAALCRDGTDVAIVSSGAIKAGKERLARIGVNHNNLRLDKKELAGIGARHLLNRWGHAFWCFKMPIAQVWVTYGNWTAKQEKNSIKSSILNYQRCGIVPIVNENDVVSDREIQLMEHGISENDRLAGMVASLIGADSILFLTDVGGIYHKDPRSSKHAMMYAEIDWGTGKHIIDSFHGKSLNGAGGIKAKLAEASRCFEDGMRVAIAGVEDNTISDFARGQAVGTMIGTAAKFK